MTMYSWYGKEVRQQEKEKQLARLVESTRSQLTGFAQAAENWVRE